MPPSRGRREAMKLLEQKALLADLTYAECPETAKPQTGNRLAVFACQGETVE